MENLPINETVVVDWLKNEHMNLTDEIKTMLMRIIVERVYIKKNSRLHYVEVG